MGYDVFKECIPVVPAQHYFMGGVKVDYQSRSSMENLYVVGEAACNGVHGKKPPGKQLPAGKPCFRKTCGAGYGRA